MPRGGRAPGMYSRRCLLPALRVELDQRRRRRYRTDLRFAARLCCCCLHRRSATDRRWCDSASRGSLPAFAQHLLRRRRDPTQTTTAFVPGPAGRRHCSADCRRESSVQRRSAPTGVCPCHPKGASRPPDRHSDRKKTLVALRLPWQVPATWCMQGRGQLSHHRLPSALLSLPRAAMRWLSPAQAETASQSAAARRAAPGPRPEGIRWGWTTAETRLRCSNSARYGEPHQCEAAARRSATSAGMASIKQRPVSSLVQYFVQRVHAGQRPPSRGLGLLAAAEVMNPLRIALGDAVGQRSTREPQLQRQEIPDLGDWRRPRLAGRRRAKNTAIPTVTMSSHSSGSGTPLTIRSCGRVSCSLPVSTCRSKRSLAASASFGAWRCASVHQDQHRRAMG